MVGDIWASNTNWNQILKNCYFCLSQGTTATKLQNKNPFLESTQQQIFVFLFCRSTGLLGKPVSGCGFAGLGWDCLQAVDWMQDFMYFLFLIGPEVTWSMYLSQCIPGVHESKQKEGMPIRASVCNWPTDAVIHIPLAKSSHLAKPSISGTREDGPSPVGGTTTPPGKGWEYI